jgi:hypothetical protein
MKAKNIVVAASILLNVALIVYLATGHTPDVILNAPAYGQNRAVSGGGYVGTTALMASNRQALYLIDNTEKRMILYGFPSGRGAALDGLASRDLRIDFGPNLAGDLMVLPGEITSGVEAVYVIDPVGKKLVVYSFRGTGKEIELMAQRDLSKDFKVGAK